MNKILTKLKYQVLNFFNCIFSKHKNKKPILIPIHEFYVLADNIDLAKGYDANAKLPIFKNQAQLFRSKAKQLREEYKQFQKNTKGLIGTITNQEEV